MKLDLYMFDGCPFCRRVTQEIEREGRTDVIFHDIHKSAEDEKFLLENGGKTQVPCLFIDGKPLYESGDIVAFLEAHPQGAAV